MADVDRRLRGKGFPKNVPLRPIEREVQLMDQFIDERISSELAMWAPKSRLEYLYERNKFWVWAIPVLLTIAVVVIAVVKLLAGA